MFIKIGQIASALWTLSDPSFTLYGTSTAGSFFDAIKSGDVASGNINRFLIVWGDSDAQLGSLDFDAIVADAPPQKLVDHLKRFIDPKAGLPSGAVGSDEPTLVKVEPAAQ